MSSVKAIYKDGVFKPVEGEDLSLLGLHEGQEIRVSIAQVPEPRRLTKEERQKVFRALVEHAADLEPDLAARHNENF